MTSSDEYPEPFPCPVCESSLSSGDDNERLSVDPSRFPSCSPWSFRMTSSDECPDVFPRLLRESCLKSGDDVELVSAFGCSEIMVITHFI